MNVLKTKISKKFKFNSATYFKFFKLNSFESELFKFMMKANRVVLIFDSMDEILPRYSEKFKTFIELIFSINGDQRMKIFTRPYFDKMDKFKFLKLKMNEFHEGLRNTFIDKYLAFKHPRMSRDKCDNFNVAIDQILNQNNFTSLQLVRMTLDYFTRSTDNSIDSYNTFNSFMTEIWKLTDEKNAYIRENISELDDFHKYFQKLAMERLIVGRNDSKRKYTRMSQRELKNSIDAYFFDVKYSSEEILQRFGVIQFDHKSNAYKFKKTSFEDFYVAKFMMDKNLSDPSTHHLLLELLSILFAENRLSSVLEFLKSAAVYTKNLTEYNLLHQMLTQKMDASFDDQVNVAPIIEYLVNIISNHANMNRICIQKNIHLSAILFSDPMESLKRIYACKGTSWKVGNSWNLYVNENILMNKNHLNTHNFDDDDDTPNAASISTNVIDVLGYCGMNNKRKIKYFVTKQKFEVYFNFFTIGSFNEYQLAIMLDATIKSKPDYRKSLFLMAKCANKIVIESLLNFYEEKLLSFNHFRNPLFSSFIFVLILNENFDNIVKLRILVTKILNANQYADQKLNFEIKWFIILAENMKDASSNEQVKIAMDFLIEIIDEKLRFFQHCREKNDKEENFLFVLLDSVEPDILRTVLIKIVEFISYDLMRILLMERNSLQLTLIQMSLSRVISSEHSVFVVEAYEKVFGEKLNNLIEPLLIQQEFINEFFRNISLTSSDKTEKIPKTLSIIMKYLCDRDLKKKFLLCRNKYGDTLLLTLLKCQNEDLLNCLFSLFSDLLGWKILKLCVIKNIQNESFLSKLSYTETCHEIKDFIIDAFKMQVKFGKACSKPIYELCSNEKLSEKQFSDILSVALSSFEDNQIENQVFAFEDPFSSSSIFIAAAKCQKSGRVKSLMTLFENKLFSDSFMTCLLRCDVDIRQFSIIISPLE